MLSVSKLLGASFSKPTFFKYYLQARHINLQEYQCKKILQDNGVSVQKFGVVENLKQVDQVLQTLQSEEYVVKAQILAGGRGKGVFKRSKLQGGVKLSTNPIEVRQLVSTMLGDSLVTKQTSKEGVLVEQVMIAEAVRLKKEYYLAIVLDRSFDAGPMIVASIYGGMDIEEVAAKSNETISKFTIPLDLDMTFETARLVIMQAFNLSLKDTDIMDQCADQLIKLYKLFKKLDATQIEINPMGVTNKRQVICVDAKFQFDENARFRQRWLDKIEQADKQQDSRENEAKKYNLNFISLDGNIGCLVNGAGLAMATMDLIKLHGGEPANFLDVGGSASSEQIFHAFKIIASDMNVCSIFVNIFGGIMRCDVVAQGLVDAVKKLKIQRPVVVRFQGSKVNEAKQILAASEFDIAVIDDLDEASQAAVQTSK